MPIVTKLPDIHINSYTTVPSAIPEPPKSTLTSIVPEARIASLLKYVEGYPWTVNYYGMIINEYNTIEHFDPIAPDLTQSFYKVNNLILQVSTPLSSNYDSSSGITTISGSAITPYTLKPNVGDIFIALVDSGEEAMFIVTSVIRKTYRKDSLYEISYNLFSYISDNPSFLTTLTSRIQDEYYFNKDTNFFNRDVLITPRVREATTRLNSILKESKEYYFATFAQREVGSLMIPGIDYKIYDPLLVDFISSTVDISDLSTSFFFRHNFLNNKYLEQPSIYRLLITRNKRLLPTIHKKYKFISTSALNNLSRLGSIFHTRSDYIIYPLEPNTSTDIVNNPEQLDALNVLSNIKNSKNYFLPNITVETINNNNVYSKQLLHELFVEDYYVVSKNFYDYIDDNSKYSLISYIELLIYKYISNEAIAREDLVVAIQEYMNWSLLHQMYLLPVMWLLVKVNL